jgi:glycosyltransferase involved in cell wall biosynthesis
VCNSTWNISNFRQNIISMLLEKGHEVFVLAPLDEYISYKKSFPQVKHISLLTLKRNSTNPINDFLLFRELYKRYKEFKLDFVIHYTHKPNIFGSIAAKLLGIRSVAVVTGLGYGLIRNGLLNYTMSLLYKLSAGKKELTIFLNEDDRALFINKKITEPSKSIVIAGSGVDTAFYKIDSTIENKDFLNFVFVGRLLKDKGIFEYVEAANHFKAIYSDKIKFTVVGDFDRGNPSSINKESLYQWIKDETIDYKGFISDIRPFLAEADCVVLPSYREGVPRTILEAMAMRKPIITSNVAGCRETVHEGLNGFLIESQSGQALIEGIDKFLLLNKDERIEMGLKGREMAEKKFDSKIIAETFYRNIEGYLQ